ncbi:MAG: dihydrolipoamide acetyltransferase family protein [bacterium]
MGLHTIKLPDVGEGIAEAEFVELHVKPGDEVKPDQTLADVMTDKATVEIPSPVNGKVVWVGPVPGEIVSVGTEIIRLEVDGEGNTAKDAPLPEKTVDTNSPATTESRPETKPETPAKAEAAAAPPASMDTAPSSSDITAPMSGAARAAGEKPLASPAVRARARGQGIDLYLVHGTGPAGRITHEDLNAYAARGNQKISSGGVVYAVNTSIEEVKVIGLRRKIAEKMQDAKRRIPHFSYVEETDVTALEDLRAQMNKTRAEGQPKLTVLPFIMRALVLAIRDFPQMNVRFDDENDLVQRYGAAHIGIATQTPNGLIVPVIRHAEANSLWQNAAEVKRLADAARNGSAKREELSGSTITITSLGPLGGVVTTPVINHPEVAILGINKIMTRPVYNEDGILVPRKMMNLSSSFDHRVVDGWDAAEFIQTIKAYLEYPATMFME